MNILWFLCEGAEDVACAELFSNAVQSHTAIPKS